MALVAEPTLLSGPAIHAAQAPRAAFRHLWHDDYVKYISGECAKVWVRVVVLDWQQAPSPVTTARPPSESSPLRRQPVVAPPPPAPPEDTRAVVLKVIAGENGLARLRPPPVSLSSVAFPLNPGHPRSALKYICVAAAASVTDRTGASLGCCCVPLLCTTRASTSHRRCAECGGRLTRHHSRTLEVRQARGACA